MATLELLLLLIFASSSRALSVAFHLGHCSSSMFQCNNTLCIPKAWKCDLDDDCGDMSDELPPTCSKHVCRSTHFTCQGGKCIPKSFVCDGDKDCPSGEDEDITNCKNRSCNSFEYRCITGNCIPSWWVCDGTPDCETGEDENNCEVISKCESDEFKCDNGNCIDDIFKCDTDDDCGDNSDEKNCQDKICVGDQFQCDNKQRCILKMWRCDGDFDCNDHSDEKNCEETQTRSPICKSDEYYCPGQFICIPKTWLCNGIRECLDGSDESADRCKNVTCRMDEFLCRDRKCIPGYLQCNGKPECSDGSDEENCPSPDKSCEDDEFKCGEGMCIPSTQVCNAHPDCPNGEDEPGEKCFIDECKSGNGGCNQLCVDTPVGYHCACRSGYKLVDNFTCDDIDECEDASSCSQVCINEKGTFKCECEEGYLRDPHNHRLCKAASGETSLIFTRRYDIRLINLMHKHTHILVNSTKSSIALDFHYKSRTIFWSDGIERKIYKTKMYTSNDHVPVIDKNLTLCDGLAVDWIYEHIYWTDTGRDSIMVANLDGSMRKTLINTGLDKPRAIALNPVEGWMFWSDWGNYPRIERAGLDGSHRSTIATYDIQWPNGLTLDFVRHRLYWIDTRLDIIFSVNYDGSSRKIILKDSHFIGHPFSITVFEDNLYWTDFLRRSIFKANKFDGSNVTAVTGEHSINNPMVVHVFHPYRQPDGINYCKNSKCSYLCLPRPDLGVLSTRKSYCVCPDHQNCANIDEENKYEKNIHSGTHSKSKMSQNSSKISDIEEKSMVKSSATRHESESNVGVIIFSTISILLLVSVASFVLFFAFRRNFPNSIAPVTFSNPLYRRVTDENITLTKNEEQPN